MATNTSKTPKKRQLKKTETVRERAAKQQAPRKTRRVKRTASALGRVLRAIGRFLARIFRPFAFVLIPFRTRPARFVGRVLAAVFFLRYFRESWRELRQVSWPNRKQTTQLTIAVFVFATFFALTISLVDFGLDKLTKALIIK